MASSNGITSSQHSTDGTYHGQHSFQNGSSYSHFSDRYSSNSQQNGRPPNFQAASTSYTSRFLNKQRNKLLSASATSVFEHHPKTPSSASYGLNDKGILSAYPGSSRSSPSPSKLSPWPESSRKSPLPVSSSVTIGSYKPSTLIDRLSPAPFSRSSSSHLPTASNNNKPIRLNVDNYASGALTSRLSPAPSRFLSDIAPTEKPQFLTRSLQRRLRSINFGIAARLNRRKKELKAAEAEDSEQSSEEEYESEEYESEEFESEELECESDDDEVKEKV